MAANTVPLPISLHHNVPVNHASSQHPGSQSNGGGATNVFSEEGKIRELALQIHGCLLQAQLASAQSTSTVVNQQIAQAEEMSKRLKEMVVHLQESVKNLSLVGLQERFSAMATKLDLKFDVQSSKQSELTSIFLVCDAYYVEICCQDNGHVASVKLAQANNQADSEVLTQLVRALNFDAFEFHLRSLKDFYAHGAGTNDVANMFRVLSSLESVLLSITKCSPQAGLSDVILNNPLGHVIPRSAGLPMKLIFFVHPYEVLKAPTLFAAFPSDAEHKRQVDGPEIGVSFKLLLETSTKVYPFSIDPNLFDINKATFFPILPQTSVNMSLNYVLHISKAFPVCETIRKALYSVVYGGEIDQNYQPLRGPHINQCIAKDTADSRGMEMCTNKSRVVCLPSQCHHYYMPEELRSHDLSHDQGHRAGECGAMMSKVTFLHPVHTFNLVALLRKQLVYNSLVSSVLGRHPKDVPMSAANDVELIFEVQTQPVDRVTIVIDMQQEREGGGEQGYIALDFIIPDEQPTSPLVKVKVGRESTPTDNQKLSVIVNKCLSIPVTMYAVVKSPQLLEGAGAKVFLDYLQTVHHFNGELSGSGVRGREERGEGGVNVTSATRTFLGVKKTN